KTEHVAVGQNDAHEIGACGFRAPGILVREDGAVDLDGAGFAQLAAHGRERLPLVQYIVQHQDYASGDRRARRYLPGNIASASGVTVARDVEIIELQRKAKLWQQLTGEDH